MDKLTDREVDVLKMILDGYNSQEIGEKIFRSERTVHDIRENIRGKLGLFTVKRSDFFRAGREYLESLEQNDVVGVLPIGAKVLIKNSIANYGSANAGKVRQITAHRIWMDDPLGGYELDNVKTSLWVNSDFEKVINQK